MSALRQSLTRPKVWLMLAAAVYLAAAWDVTRSPERQCLSRSAIGAVRLYQSSLSPLLRQSIRCRYTPTCSEYSATALRQHGLLRGLMLTAQRLDRCTRDVPFCTPDPVTAS